MDDSGPKAPKWSPLTSVTQSQRIWTQDTAIPTSLPCCARASFNSPCSKHSSTLKVNIGRALCFFFCIFVKKQTDASVRRSEVIWFKPHLKRTPRYADWRSFGPKTRRIGHRSRAASEHHCTGHVRDIRQLWSRTLPIRPEPENRYFS